MLHRPIENCKKRVGPQPPSVARGASAARRQDDRDRAGTVRTGRLVEGLLVVEEAFGKLAVLDIPCSQTII